jgi:hypothetical protein
VVHNHAGVIDDSPADLLCPPAPILILGIHEEALVQRTDLLDHRTPDHQESPDDRIDVSDLVFVEIRKVVAAETPMARKEA